jgi:DNA-binding MarR family transcriptional regulator
MTQKPPPHIGVALWTGFRAFEHAMFARAADAGFEDITQADSDVLVHVGHDGTNMATIARARGVSKQAMQGAVRSLIKRGYLQAKPDPDDARAQKLTHTQKGRELVATLDLIKSDLHAAIEAELGPERLDALQAALDATTRVCADRAQKP